VRGPRAMTGHFDPERMGERWLGGLPRAGPDTALQPHGDPGRLPSGRRYRP